MKFYTQYDRPSVDECPLEVHLDEGLVERSGYMETEVLVNQLLQAGKSLQAFREAEYGPEEEVPDDAPASRMRSSLDLELEARELEAKLKRDKDAFEKKALLVEKEKEEVKEEKKDGSI